MSPVPFPAAEGHDGEQPPLPGDAARDDGASPVAGLPSDGGDDDFDAEADLARLLDDIDSGRVPIPSEEELRPPVAMIALGQTADVDPVLLAAMAGPDGLGGQAFAQEQAADAMPPGPLLAALTENAAANVAGLSDDALLGVMSAARRLANRVEYLELTAVAEFAARRQAQLDASIARKVPAGQRAGQFADAELGMQLRISGRAAGDRMDLATALATRLPRTFAGLGAGAVDAAQACSIWFYTRFLSDADAAHADAVLAAAAPRVRADTLARKAAALEMELDPEAARARKEHARKESRRVEARREPSGNMSYGGRELAVEEAVAASTAIEAEADALHRAGMAGSDRELQVLCFVDRLLGRNPFDRLRVAEPASPGDPPADSPGTDHPGPDVPGAPAGPGDPDGDPDPFPALINLLVPVGTQLGWSTVPGQLGRWGLLDPWDTRRLVQAASKHSRTRWCVTATGPDGTAVAHGCSRGPHRWTPPPPATSRSTGPGTTRPPPGPDQYQQQQLAQLLRALNITLAPIAKGTCNHRHREDRYKPSRKLGHLIRARTATCPAPGCGASAYHADLDHTIPWPIGKTDECNISPPCRHHHRVKQAPGWKLEQISPGVMRWTAPSGRTYTTTPTVYDT
jgi:hypothetical protein